MQLEDAIPDKLYFKIGEVARILGVEPYVLRYWETEFPEIAPVKSKTKQRLYKKKDVELISSIKDLLYKQNFTIKGARRRIKELKHKNSATRTDQAQIGFAFTEDTAVATPASRDVFREIISEMEAFLKA